MGRRRADRGCSSAAILVAGVAALGLAATSAERMERLTSFADPFASFQGAGWQAAHGIFALSTGGCSARASAPASRSGATCPAAHTDFIFAVLGEELGLVGTLLVLGLFLALAYAGLRVAPRTTDPFVRYMAAGITVWITAQTMINVGMVLALLPVIGIPLPLVSYGGSALLPSLVALGLLLSFARHEPGAAGGAAGQAAPRATAGVTAGGRSRRPRGDRGARLCHVDATVLLAGGGTAGHTSPLLATADALRRLDPTIEVTALGTAARPGDPGGPRGRLPARAGPAGAAAAPLAAGPAPRARPAARPRSRRPLEVLDRVRPDVVVGFGGYVSVPAYLAARRRRLPLVVHEANALPGLANRLGARLTRHVATSFPDTPLRHGAYLGLPIRRMISTLDRAGAARRGARALRAGPRPARRCWSPAARRAPGGSTQSVSAAPPARSRAAGVQVLHVVGPQGRGRRSRAGAPATPPYVVVPYVDRMDLAYAAADLVVCRAGANTVTEVAAVGLPAVFVPLPIGNGEQALNARPVVDAGGGLLVDDAACTPEWVRATVPRLLTDPDAAGGDVARPRPALIPRDADERLARMVLRGGRREAGGERPGPRRAAARRAARPGALRRHRRRRAVRRSRASCWPAGITGQRQRRQGLAARSPRCARSARRVHVGHAAEHVGDADTVVVSTAVREDNPEVVEARRQGLRLLPALGRARRR